MAVEFKPVPLAKFTVLVIILLFIAKLLTGFVAAKFPNTVTNAINTVTQGA